MRLRERQVQPLQCHTRQKKNISQPNLLRPWSATECRPNDAGRPNDGAAGGKSDADMVRHYDVSQPTVSRIVVHH